MKTYTIYFIIKMDGTERWHETTVEARNQKEACAKVKDECFRKTGRNAFHPMTTFPARNTHEIIPGYPPHK